MSPYDPDQEHAEEWKSTLLEYERNEYDSCPLPEIAVYAITALTILGIGIGLSLAFLYC